jgi:hypothetical protein
VAGYACRSFGQVKPAVGKRGEGDLAALFNSGDTWTVE